MLGALILLLASTAGCSAAAGGNGGAPGGVLSAETPPGTARPAPAQIPSAAATARPATSAAAARLEAALAKLAREAEPGTEQIRAALVEAGFPRDGIEVTASRTPTGLQADAVEAAVRQDRDCVVAQLRNGTVAVTVLTVLADGRCFAGRPA